MKMKAALTYYAEMWDIIAEKNCYQDDAYTVLRERHPELPEYIQLCSFPCEYDFTHGGNHCFSRCILTKIWGEGHCNSEGSPFHFWGMAKCKIRKTEHSVYYYAKQIADGCRKLLKEMN